MSVILGKAFVICIIMLIFSFIFMPTRDKIDMSSKVHVGYAVTTVLLFVLSVLGTLVSSIGLVIVS